MEREIQPGGTLLAFLTMLVLRLDALFLSRLTVLKSKGKEKPKFSKKDFKKKSREINLLEKQASHQREKYLKYKNLNKSFSKKKLCVILEDS